MRLEITGPTVECDDCRFGSYVAGTFSVEGGRLVWRGDRTLFPHRGADLDGCSESSPYVECVGIEVDGVILSEQEFNDLKRTEALDNARYGK